VSKYLNDTGLSAVWTKIKALIPTKVSQLTNDSGFINNEHMGYISNGYLYIPRGYTYRNGDSNYTYTFPFIVSSGGSINLKNTTKLREIGSTTNLFSVGSIDLDSASTFVNSILLQPYKLYIYRHSDGVSHIKTVCTIPDLQNAISGKLDAPSTAGTAGQVLSTNGTNTIWVNLANSYDLNLGTAIPVNADLNTYTTAGVYNVDSTVAGNISNAPIYGVPYKLIVESIDDAIIRQIVITSSDVYQRTGDSSSSSWVFSDWVKYITSADFCTQAEIEEMLSANGFDAIVVEEPAGTGEID